MNAGNANACTGPEGLEDAAASTRGVSELLQIPERLVLPASTGVIGQPFPLAKITLALPKLVGPPQSPGFSGSGRSHHDHRHAAQDRAACGRNSTVRR